MSKTVAVFIVTIVLVIALHAFRSLGTSNIKGRVISRGGGVHVWAVRGSDSIKVSAQNGFFTLPVKPGSWKVLVGKQMPWPDMGMTVDVPEGQTTDLGIIRLY